MIDQTRLVITANPITGGNGGAFPRRGHLHRPARGRVA